MQETLERDEPERILDDKEAPLIEHLTELRSRLMRALIALALCIIVCFVFAREIFQFLSAPLSAGLIERGLSPNQIITGLHEKFITDMRLALYAGLFVAFPFIANQLWRFVAPGLYQDEKQAFWPFLVATPILFATGGALVYYVVAPLAFGFFLDYTLASQAGDTAAEAAAAGGTVIDIEPRVSEYLSLMMTFIFAFGLAFQLPVLLTLLGRAGIVSSEQLARGRKFAVVGILAVAAILTPPDFFSQIGLGVPMYLLYEISIFLVARVERKREEREAEEAF